MNSKTNDSKVVASKTSPSSSSVPISKIELEIIEEVNINLLQSFIDKIPLLKYVLQVLNSFLQLDYHSKFIDKIKRINYIVTYIEYSKDYKNNTDIDYFNDYVPQREILLHINLIIGVVYFLVCFILGLLFPKIEEWIGLAMIIITFEILDFSHFTDKMTIMNGFHFLIASLCVYYSLLNFNKKISVICIILFFINVIAVYSFELYRRGYDHFCERLETQYHLVVAISYICTFIPIFVLILLLFFQVVSHIKWLNKLTSTQRKKINKVKLIENDLDKLIAEKEAEDGTTAHIKINKDLFEICYDNVKIISKIADGSHHSKLFKAKWRSKIIVWKSFKLFYFNDQEKFAELEQEMNMLSSCSNHPNIIEFFGAAMKGAKVGLAIEYCFHGNVEQFLKNFKKEHKESFPLEHKLIMIKEILLGILYLNSKKIIHRDLNLSNICVKKNNEIRITDFGISVSSEDDDGFYIDKDVVGTKMFLASEIVKEGRYSLKSDVYAFGILCYMLLYENYSPYDEDIENIEVRCSNDPNYRPQFDNENEFTGLEWLNNLLIRCWKHDPNERPTPQEIYNIICGSQNNIGAIELDIEDVEVYDIDSKFDLSNDTHCSLVIENLRKENEKLRRIYKHAD